MVDLATVDGVTRQEAHENYMRALAQVVTYVFMETRHFRLTPDYELMARQVGAPHPRVFASMARVQASTWYASNPRHLRTIELVSG